MGHWTLAMGPGGHDTGLGVLLLVQPRDGPLHRAEAQHHVCVKDSGDGPGPDGL